MKSYLSLIPISARVRRRQNRLTILCIVTAVFLVTAIFSVADMMLRTQTGRAAGKSGSWHLEVTGITPEQAAQLVGQPDVVRVGAGAVFNENGESAYRLNGKRVVLYGADADYVSLNRAAAFAGTYPQAENEVLLGKTAARVLHVGSGDTVTLTLPDGTEKPLTVTGVGGIASISGSEKIKRNLFLRPTNVDLSILDVVPADKVNEMSTNELADYSRGLIERSLPKAVKEAV